MHQYCCKTHKCAHFYSFSKLGATLGTLPPGPAAQVQSRGQNRLLTLRYTPEEAISEKILKFRSHSSDICKKCNFYQNSPFSQKLNITTLYSENWTFFKTHEIEYTPSTMFKRHYIDEIEYPPSPICGEKPQFESNVTSFQFRQNASAFWRGIYYMFIT